MMHSEFNRSSVCREFVKSVVNELREWDQHHDWKVFYPIMFCVTRWVGIQRCVTVISRNVTTLLSYAEKLRSKNMGSREFDPYKYKRRRGQVEAVEAGADDDAGEIDEEDSEDEEEVLRVQEAITASRLDTDGYQPRAQFVPHDERGSCKCT